MEFTVPSVLEAFSSMTNETRRAINLRQGVHGNQSGVPMGPLRALARKIKQNHTLGVALWHSLHYEAMITGAMIMNPQALTEKDFEDFLAEAWHYTLVDELTFGPFTESPLADAFMEKWRSNDEERTGQAGWNLAVEHVRRQRPSDGEITLLLEEITATMVSASPRKQWAMNHCLCEIGIRYDDWTDKCLAIGERLGVYRDLKVAKGCTSAYALAWIPVGRAKRKA